LTRLFAGSFFSALQGSEFGRVLLLQANEEVSLMVGISDGAHDSKRKMGAELPTRSKTTDWLEKQK
jgi:hypothetical protein